MRPEAGCRNDETMRCVGFAGLRYTRRRFPDGFQVDGDPAA